MLPRILDIQLSQILSALSPTISFEDLLKKQSSLVSRRRRGARGVVHSSQNIVKTLGLWVATPGSSLFVLRSGPSVKALATGHAVDIIKYLRSTQYKVFWVLPSSNANSNEPSTVRMLQSLIFQVISCDPDVLLRFPETLNSLLFLATHTENEWWELLSMLISRLDKCFLIVETEDLFQAAGRNPEWTRGLLEAFQCLVKKVDASGSVVKVLVVSFGALVWDEGISGSTSRFVTTIKPLPPPHRVKRGMSRKFGRGLA